MKGKVIEFLMKYGKIEVVNPQNTNQGGNKNAKQDYYLYLKEGTEVTEELKAYCKLHDVVIQGNLF